VDGRRGQSCADQGRGAAHDRPGMSCRRRCPSARCASTMMTRSGVGAAMDRGWDRRDVPLITPLFAPRQRWSSETTRERDAWSPRPLDTCAGYRGHPCDRNNNFVARMTTVASTAAKRELKRRTRGQWGMLCERYSIYGQRLFAGTERAREKCQACAGGGIDRMGPSTGAPAPRPSRTRAPGGRGRRRAVFPDRPRDALHAARTGAQHQRSLKRCKGTVETPPAQPRSPRLAVTPGCHRWHPGRWPHPWSDASGLRLASTLCPRDALFIRYRTLCAID